MSVPDISQAMAQAAETASGDEDDDENEIYEIDCPECGEKIFLSEELVDNEEIICPSCLKKRRFEEDEEDD